MNAHFLSVLQHRTVMRHLSKEQIRQQLKNKTVGIAGAGGLGSNCAVALARAGVGKLVIADFDVVSRDNLDRQYYFLYHVGQKKVYSLKEIIAGIDPSVTVEIHDLMLDKNNIPLLFRSCDVVVEAFDQAPMKQMIAETMLEKLPGKFLVMGNGVAGFGGNNAIRTRQAGKIYICGDGESEISESLPPLAPRVGIVAGMQANQVLELLLK